MVRLLGPVGVECARGLMPVGGPRSRRIMAALALQANRAVSVSFLIDATWGDFPPSTCREQVHNCVGRLRRLLRTVTGDDVVVSRVAEGYRLDIDASRVDAYTFEKAVRGARALAAAGNVADAVQLGRSGLQQWYGDALQGVADGALAGEAARLEELRLAAYEDLFAHELRLGTPASSLIGEISALARRYPLHERLTWQLMTALHRAGRSAEALQSYREHRERLVSELGIEPDPALRALELEILRTGQDAGDGRGGPPDDTDLATLVSRLADLAREVAWRLQVRD